MSNERILIADDHDSLRRGMVRALQDAGHEVDEASNGNAAIELLHKGQFDVVVSDLKMGGSDGLDVLRTAKALHPTAVVILMTGFGSVQTAVEAMKIGAFDFVQKPFEIEEMELRIAKALEHRRLQHEIDYLRHTQPDIYDFDRIVGASGALQRVLNVVKKVAQSNTTVLIRGETGTGKELIAGAIHHNSARANRNFVRVNCAALQENLLESELFGHEKGAFTGADRQRVGRFEQADGGSLFLDEVGDMSANTQAKILRVLQEHEFERLGGTRTLRCDVRIVAATNRNLADMVASGQFREDLYYRLNVVSIDMPPLRERKEDIPELAHFFTRRFGGELNKKVTGLDAAAEKLLKRHNWPGNIRELKRFSNRPCTTWGGRGTFAHTDAGGPMRAYSMDLRERALLDSDAGMKAADVAAKYRVSGSWVRLLKQRRRETGEVAPRVQRHGRRCMLEPHLHTLAALIAAQPDCTLAELKDALATPASVPTVWRAVRALGLTVKKNGPPVRTRSV